MATNKRKESAALFELLDKSTLKVPKGGSLKIPAWWSSKTNPAGTTPVASAPAAAARPLSAGKPAVNGSAEKESASVLIRTPKSTAVAAASGASAVSPTAAPAAVAPAQRSMSAAPAPEKRTPSGIFAPQTHDQSVRTKERMGGAPPVWLMIAGAAAGVLLILGLIYILTRAGQASKPASDRGVPIVIPPPITDAGNHQSPPQNVQNPQNPPQDPPQNPPQNQQPPVQNGQARVVPVEEIKRTPNYFYLMIFYADESTAAANAKYLADHGVSTSVVPTAYPKYFELVSVDGFQQMGEPRAVALQKQVIELGRAHPDAKKARAGVYDTAYYKKLVRQ